MPRPCFPDDLLQLELDVMRTYEHLAQQPRPDTAALRRRLIAVSWALAAHPYWAEPGRSPAARVALRRQARAQSDAPAVKA
ncbi:hypothetical protein [Streptomyces subrutilus]|uniref:Uncharacterized protein n=1 Tax=Streptomyces subrutilus TaxID=36818 RepID=A0A1E5NXV1_9ACTN|nr:hypothetical protein [Streptomyces subrutilus]OEJ21070.1 hypothetical protein BGK67_34825 [Streptomyces subrutilus]